MKLYIANPIYDTVFKYLMEDERIARTLLSALLKKNVVHVEQRPHEYANVSRNEISMFRIDFGATIREEDGREHLVLIELQKTWVETETLRFRQYLGAQYSRKDNIVEESRDKHALPMIAVYMLGHRVGNIQEPVVYVSHKLYDYDGRILDYSEPNPFVESLTHDSIIVQIPLLHGRVNNRLERVLSVFDQTHVTKSSMQTIEVNESEYAGDADMEYILKRLLSAASNPDVRQDMNVEDEFFKAIEDRDTAIMSRDKTIREKNKVIQEKNEEIQEKNEVIQEKNEVIQEQGRVLQEQGKALQEQNLVLREKDNALQEKDNALQEQGKVLQEKNRILANAVNSMIGRGMDLHSIAVVLGVTEEDIASIVASGDTMK